MVTKKGTDKSDTLYGRNDDDILYGRGGNDTLFGLGGNDTLYGGEGDDYLKGSRGNDTIIGTIRGSDEIDGGRGVDTLNYSNIKEGFFLDLGDTWTGWDGIAYKRSTRNNFEADDFRGIEVFILSQGSDSFNMYTTGYHVQIFGGDGLDRIMGYGSVMRGDAGEDGLIGGQTTSDTFWLQRGQGADRAINFTSGQDLIRLNGNVFDLGAKVESREIAYTNGDQDVVGNSARLIWDEAKDKLYYDPDGAGADEAELLATFYSSSDNASYLDFEIV